MGQLISLAVLAMVIVFVVYAYRHGPVATLPLVLAFAGGIADVLRWVADHLGPLVDRLLAWVLATPGGQA